MPSGKHSHSTALHGIQHILSPSYTEHDYTSIFHKAYTLQQNRSSLCKGWKSIPNSLCQTCSKKHDNLDHHTERVLLACDHNIFHAGDEYTLFCGMLGIHLGDKGSSSTCRSTIFYIEPSIQDILRHCNNSTASGPPPPGVWSCHQVDYCPHGLRGMLLFAWDKWHMNSQVHCVVAHPTSSLASGC